MGHLLTILQKKKTIVHDGFNRADNASLGNANTGQAWVVSGAFAISGNAAISPGGFGTAVINAGVSDCIISVKMGVPSSVSRVAFRSTSDVDRLIVTMAGAYGLFKTVAGVSTSLGSYSGVPANGDVVRIVVVGSAIKVYVNGALVISVTEAYNQTATNHGINTSIATATFDEFMVEAL